MLNGIPPQSIRKVIGVAKAYDTYVGAKKFEPDLQILRDIRKIGQEFGATTGRPRQVNFLDITKLIKAIRINGATDLIINKVDILEQLDCWNIIIDNKTVNLGNKQTFMTVVKDTVEKNCKTIADIKFSFTPNDI
jgi:adenylosuccinate synthase